MLALASKAFRIAEIREWEMLIGVLGWPSSSLIIACYKIPAIREAHAANKDGRTAILNVVLSR